MLAKSWMPGLLGTTLGALLMTMGVFLWVSPSPGYTEEPIRESTQLRQKIKRREAEIKRLQSRRERLEKTARLQSRELRQYEIQFRHYLANLENSEKRAQALEQDLLQLVERARERDLGLQVAFQLAGQNPVPGSEGLRQAAISVVAHLYQQELEERPLRQELQRKIDTEQAYQQRIRERYMVNDQIRRDRIEKRLSSSQDKAEANMKAEQRIVAELQDLRRRLKVLDERLAQLRRQSEEGARSGQTSQAPFRPGQPFVRLKSRLPSPAPGKIVRGYGPFTHPTLGVKLESKGIDVSVKSGTTAKAVADGRVLYIGVLEHYGPIVALDHGDGYLTVYGNVEAGKLRVGQVIPAGHPIGVVSQNNREDDPVYHFEIRRGDRALDPSAWLGR